MYQYKTFFYKEWIYIFHVLLIACTVLYPYATTANLLRDYIFLLWYNMAFISWAFTKECLLSCLYKKLHISATYQCGDNLQSTDLYTIFQKVTGRKLNGWVIGIIHILIILSVLTVNNRSHISHPVILMILVFILHPLYYITMKNRKLNIFITCINFLFVIYITCQINLQLDTKRHSALM